MGLNLDLDEGGFLGAVRRIGLPAPSADARIGRRVALLGALLKPGPLGAAVAGPRRAAGRACVPSGGLSCCSLLRP